MLEYLDTVHPDEVIVFIDAFDVVILRDAEEIEATFKALNVPMLFSVEKPYANILLRYLYRKMYRYTCQGHGLCAGLYMGYASKMKSFLRAMITKLRVSDPRADDQLLLMQYSRESPDQYYVDATASIFLNIHGGTRWWPSFTYFVADDNQYFRINQGKHSVLTTLEGVRPCILHGPGNTDMDMVIDRLGYEPPLPETRSSETVVYYLRSLRHYLPYFKTEIAIGLVLMMLLIRCLSRFTR